MSATHSFGKSALLIAHPGHEIRVHGWLEQARPIVYILTDGSGRSGQSRLESTKRILKQAGAQIGDAFGQIADRALYDRVLCHDLDFFRNLIARLSQELILQQFDFVLGDAADGSILAHDIWRGAINTAVDLAEMQLGRRIHNFEFALEGPPAAAFSARGDEDLLLRLDNAAFARKMSAARAYRELTTEVEATLSAHGEDAFRIEHLKRTNARQDLHHAEAPAYQHHGEMLVQAGVYREAVRYQQHVRPLLAAIQLAALQQQRAA